jgi:hypothetical protein
MATTRACLEEERPARQAPIDRPKAQDWNNVPREAASGGERVRAVRHPDGHGSRAGGDGRGLGGDAQAVQAALFPWFVPTLLTGALSVALGAFVAPYVIAATGVVALWPLAFEMWRHREAPATRHPRPLPAT